MRAVSAAVAVACWLLTPGGACADEAAALGSHPLRGLDGHETTLDDFRGDVVVVNFWASWCAPCRKELPILDAWHARWVGNGARVVAVSVDRDADNARRFVESTGLRLPVVLDGPDGLARTLRLPALPCTYVLDGDGRIVETVPGASSAGLARVERAVNGLLTSRAPVATRASLGGASAGVSP